MSVEGPSLQSLVHRLAECPEDFLAEPGAVDVAAVVSDLVRALGGGLLTPPQLALFRSVEPSGTNRLRISLIATWILYDPWFQGQRDFATPALGFLMNGLHQIAPIVDAGKFVSDPDRREELVRLALAAMNLRPAGESDAQADDRLNTLNSVERMRVNQDTSAARERVRQIREAMKRKAAEEAAASYGRE